MGDFDELKLMQLIHELEGREFALLELELIASIFCTMYGRF